MNSSIIIIELYFVSSNLPIYSMEGSLDENRELPGHFLHELYKWALECELKK